MSNYLRKLCLSLTFVWAFLTFIQPSLVLAERSLKAVIQDIHASYPNVPHLNPTELNGWIESGKSFVLLDARSLEEFELSHLHSARRIDPELKDFSGLDEKFPKESNIVVYCSVGWRSAKLADRLHRAGYSSVWNLEGSIFAWVEDGYPVFSAGEQVQAVHPYDSSWGKLLPQQFHPQE